MTNSLRIINNNWRLKTGKKHFIESKCYSLFFIIIFLPLYICYDFMSHDDHIQIWYKSDIIHWSVLLVKIPVFFSSFGQAAVNFHFYLLHISSKYCQRSTTFINHERFSPNRPLTDIEWNWKLEWIFLWFLRLNVQKTIQFSPHSFIILYQPVDSSLEKETHE